MFYSQEYHKDIKLIAIIHIQKTRCRPMEALCLCLRLHELSSTNMSVKSVPSDGEQLKVREHGQGAGATVKCYMCLKICARVKTECSCKKNEPEISTRRGS